MAAATTMKAMTPAKSPGGILITNTEELIQFATIMFKAGPPKGFNKPESLAVAIAFGMELGLKPATAPSLIKVVNGKPSADGEAALALLLSCPLVESLNHGVEGQGDEMYGWIETKRKGNHPPRKNTFSVKDARAAGLWESSDPWKKYPKRMLVWRAVGFHAKDWWADVMCGLVILDEIAEAEAAGPRVEVVGVQTDPPAPQALAAPSANGAPLVTSANNPAGPITDHQKEKFVQNREPYLKSLGVDTANKEAVGVAWRTFLGRWGVDSVLKMSAGQADEALAVIFDATHTPEQKALFSNGAPAAPKGLPTTAGGPA